MRLGASNNFSVTDNEDIGVYSANCCPANTLSPLLTKRLIPADSNDRSTLEPKWIKPILSPLVTSVSGLT